MTDEELIEAMLFAAFGTSAKSFSGDMKSALAIATPEIERRLLERMREWSPIHGAPHYETLEDQVWIERLDAFAKEIGIKS